MAMGPASKSRDLDRCSLHARHEHGKWLQFEATSEAGPILGGPGNVDTYSAPNFPGRPGFYGFGLRLFDPGTVPFLPMRPFPALRAEPRTASACGDATR